MERIQRWLRWASIVLVVLLGVKIAAMRPATRELIGFMWDRLVYHGYFGVGYWDGNYNEFDFGQLEPGDIVVGGNTGSSWGYWTHSAIYIGNGQVMDTFLQTGVSPRPVTAYNKYYSHSGALKVNLPPEVKAAAVAGAKQLQGRPFYLLAPRNSTALYYCTKVVWLVYKELGYDLDPGGPYWAVPDRIYQSQYLQPYQPGAGRG